MLLALRTRRAGDDVAEQDEDSADSDFDQPVEEDATPEESELAAQSEEYEEQVRQHIGPIHDAKGAISGRSAETEAPETEHIPDAQGQNAHSQGAIQSEQAPGC